MIHPLKKSASLIIIDDEGKILLLKRLSKMSFANAFVFPGGKCEESDKVQAKSQQFKVYAKITALRECFQQTGILFYPSSYNISSLQSLSENQLISKLGDIWQGNLSILRPVIRLITPHFHKDSRRFDCLFFVLNENARYINVRALQRNFDHHSIEKIYINQESKAYLWKKPVQYFNLQKKKQIVLVPPQKIILRCISVVRDRSLIFNSDEDGMTECHTFMIGENSLLMVGDKDFKYEEFLKDEPETESKADLAKVMEKYMSSKNKVRRINNQIFRSDYQEKGIFKFLQQSSKL